MLVLIIPLFCTYQYVGMMCAMPSTHDGRYSSGTNTPHKKLNPSVSTFTIPVIAFFFKRKQLSIYASASDESVNTKAFIIKINPLSENILSPTITMLNSMKNSHTTKEYENPDKNRSKLYFL